MITWRGIGFALLLAGVVLSALGVVQSRHQYRLLFVELTRLERERDELNIDYGRLQLELATWTESNRVEQIARTRLSMRAPAPADIRVVTP